MIVTKNREKLLQLKNVKSDSLIKSVLTADILKKKTVYREL